MLASVLLSLASVAAVSADKTVKCYTYVRTEIAGAPKPTAQTKPIPIVNPVPARDAFESSEYPVRLCENYFNNYGYWSCSKGNSTVLSEHDQCCYEDMGILLLAQFWDYNVDAMLAVNGTKPRLTLDLLKLDSHGNFTLHGLWNDRCDGSYPLNCAPDLEIFDEKDNITDVIVNDFNEPELFTWMTHNWVNTEKSNVDNGGSITLWEHEYNKHGTCMNTIKPECFEGQYKRFENTVNYGKKAAELHQQLTTEKFLAAEGIVPTTEKQYALSDIEAALKKWHADADVYVGCLNGGLSEVWYYHYLKGNLLTGDYTPTNSLGKTKCPEKVWYLPK